MANKVELLKYYDENHNFLGIEERSVVDKNRMWHDQAGLWILNLENNSVLLQKRSPNKRIGANLWGLTAGHVAADETIRQALFREVEEELGLDLKEYKILKYYAKEIDILTIPFLINDITKSTSPLKLFEYMALHKPIVTTAMDECLKYKSVMTAKSGQEFLKKLEIAYENRHDKKYIKLLDKEAQENSWDEKSQILIEHLQSEESELL